MREALKRSSAGLAVIITILFVVSSLPINVSSVGTRGEQIILKVGLRDKMKTRNPLPSIAVDVWTQDILDRVYDGVGKIDPDTEEVLPYVVKGIDVDDDGVFETDEYGKFEKEDGADILNVIAYYDFNSVYFHDGVQATISDLLFSYHLQALNPRMNLDLRPLMDNAGKAGTNHTVTRWLFITPAIKNWQDEPTIGNHNLRVAVKFQLQESFALFYQSIISDCILFPRHVWEGTGWRIDHNSGDVVTDLHADFGIAIYPENHPRFGQGVPMTDSSHFVYNKPDTSAPDSAEEWQPTDNEVIGTGPFLFDSFDEQRNVMLVMKNTLFYTGKDLKTGVTLDPYVESYIHQPYIDGIRFNVYASATLGILALQSGQIDFYHWSLAPEFVPELINNPNIRIWNMPESSFSYIGFNLRRPSVGYYDWGQASQFDVGYHFRKAVAHLIDKNAIIRNFLGGYGIPSVVPVPPWFIGTPGTGPVPPYNRFYNTSLVPYEFNRTKAEEELELAHQDAVWLSNNGGPTGAALWYSRDNITGKIIMPGIGTSEFDFICPSPDYDIQVVNSCQMIALEMNRIGLSIRIRSTVPFPYTPRNFDMYAMGWRIQENDPDYLYSLFHSSNAAQGYNYVGFNDPTMDRILEDARKEMNESKRISLFKWAQGILWDKLPVNVLYFRMNIEATRQDRFVGWKPVYGSIFNQWSLLDIWQPNVPSPWCKNLSVNIEAPSAIASNDTKSVAVTVRDENGGLVNGADVSLVVAPFVSGNFSIGDGSESSNITGKTINGSFAVSYHAPDIDYVLNATITTTVAYKASPEVARSKIVAIFPADAHFLAITFRYFDSDIVTTNGMLRIGIEVHTSWGIPSHNANVSLRLNGTLDLPYGVFPTQGNASAMQEIMFKAPPSNLLEENETLFILIAEASFPRYQKGVASIGIVVVKLYKTCPEGTVMPTDMTCPVHESSENLIVVGCLVVIAIILLFEIIRRLRVKKK